MLIFYLSIGALVLAAAGWFAGWAALFFARRLSSGVSDAAGAAAISVIIPARNEEKRLGPLLSSLRAQTVPPLEVIVVDDESADGTRLLAEAVGATVLAAPPRPAGWLGKPWACHNGAARARGKLLLFLDADVRLAPDALARLAAAARLEKGLISVQPWHRIGRLYENWSAFCNLAVMIGADSFSLFSRPGRSSGCFGPCLLVSRTDYERLGGHAAVRGDVVEDMALGKAARGRGIPVFNHSGRKTIEFSMYPEGLPGLVEGWTKNLSRASGYSAPGQVFLLGAWISGVMASLSLPFFLWSSAAAPAVLPVVMLLFTVQMFVQLRRVGGFHPAAAFLFPLPVLFFLFVFFRSAVRTNLKRRVTWKGREIDIPP